MSCVQYSSGGGVTSCGGDDDETSFSSTTTVVENTEEKLGAVATGVNSANTSVATAEIPTEGDNANNIVITSKAKGTSIITATKSGYTDASFTVTVSDSGAITLGEITKFEASETPSGEEGDGTQKTVSSIAVKTEPTKKDYALNTGFSADGLVITLTYSDGDTEDVTYSAENAADFSFDFDSSSEGTKEVTVTYKSRSAAEKITVTVTDKKVIKLEKSAGATAVEVKYGTEASAITGLSLVVTYDQGDPETITSGYTVTGYDKNTVSEQTVTVTYGTKAASDGASNSTTYTVNVVDYATGITATLADGKTYTAGDATAKTDVVVTYKMASGAAGEAVAAEKYTVTPETVKLTDTALTVTSTEDFATKTATVDITGKVARAVFTKFDVADLRALNGGNITDTGDVIINDANAVTTLTAANSSYELTVAKNKSAQVKYNAAGFTTYDYDEGTSGYKWTNRLSYNKQEEGNVSLKLYVGAANTVVLRVDGGSVKDAPNTGVTQFKFAGAGAPIEWKPYVSLCTTYIEVTGDANGYVTITSNDKTNGANIYGITMVSAKPTTNLPESVAVTYVDGETTKDLTVATAAVYNKPVIAGLSASYKQGDKIEASISNATALVTPSKTQKVYADGHLGEATAGEESVDAASIKWTATGTAEGNTEANEIGTGASLSFATSATQTENEDEKTYVPADTYRVVASYTVGKTTYSSESVTVQIKDASKTYVTVTFDKNGGTLADGAEDPTQEIESGAKTALTAFADLGITPPSGKEFAGWNTVASPTDNDTGTSYVDEAEVTLTVDTTLYAVYKAASVNYVTKGTYSLIGASKATETKPWTSQSAGGDSQTLYNITTTTKIDSSGFTLGLATDKGYATFSLKESTKVSITFLVKVNTKKDVNGGFLFSTTDGSFTSEDEKVTIGTVSASVTIGADDKNTKFAKQIVSVASSGSNTTTTTVLTLGAGTYKLYGSSTSTGALASELKFE